MKQLSVLLTVLIVTLACGSTSTPPFRISSIQTELPSSPAKPVVTPSIIPTASLPPEPTATLTLEPTATSAPTEVPTSTPVLTPTSSPTPIAPPQTVNTIASASGLISIVSIAYDGSGNKEPDEYVEIRNDSSQPIQLKGWVLQDKAKHVFSFPDFVIQLGQVCRIYTDEIHPDSCGFSFGFNDSAIWNNSGDCAYLKDQAGNMVAEYCY